MAGRRAAIPSLPVAAASLGRGGREALPAVRCGGKTNPRSRRFPLHQDATRVRMAAAAEGAAIEDNGFLRSVGALERLRGCQAGAAAACLSVLARQRAGCVG